MKNLTGKTLIFYTFQQKRQSEYNVIAFQPAQKDIRIKEVLQKLPIDLSTGDYHFRFKSEFFQGQEQIIGWIDISNLMAKVPMISNSIYIKILKVKNSQYNKLFNLQKLKRSGLLMTKQQKLNSVNKKPAANDSANVVTNAKKSQQKKVQPIKIVSQTQQKNKQTVITQKSRSNKKQENLFQFQTSNVSNSKQVPHQTQDEKLKTFKDQMKQEEDDRECQRIAREQLDQKIDKWGYSGKKIINNLTTLLATLHEIWPQWQQVSLSDMLKPQDLQNVCKKALIKTHPDKNRKQPFRTKYLSKRVFQLINEAKKQSPK